METKNEVMTFESIESSNYPDRFKKEVRSWSNISRREGYEPQIIDNIFIFKMGSGRIERIDLNEALKGETECQEFRSYINALKKGDTLTAEQWGRRITSTIKRINITREGKLSSITLKKDSERVEMDNIIFREKRGYDYRRRVWTLKYVQKILSW